MSKWDQESSSGGQVKVGFFEKVRLGCLEQGRQRKRVQAENMEGKPSVGKAGGGGMP